MSQKLSLNQKLSCGGKWLIESVDLNGLMLICLVCEVPIL